MIKLVFLNLLILGFFFTAEAQKKLGEIKHPVLKGRYIMKGANCAGFDFINPTMVLWYAELQCNQADTMRVKWVSDDMFITRDVKPFYKNCAPRVYIYKIVKNDNKQLVLKSIWTGWNDFKDSVESYQKQ